MSLRVLMACCCAVASFACGAPVWGNDVLIRGATIHTVGVRGTLMNSDLLIRDGKIAEIGRGLAAPKAAAVIEAAQRPVTPGIFGGLSALGLTEVSAEATTVDVELSLGAPAWQQQWRPEFDVTEAYNPRSGVIPVARIEGLTWTILAPRSGDSILSGQGAAIALDGRFDAVLARSRALFVETGSAALTASGGSRAGQFMLLDQAIREVRGGETSDSPALLHPAGREALARYLAGGRVVFHAERAADIRRVVAFARRAGMRPIISGGAEAWIVAAELARLHVPVILNPLQNLPVDFDQLAARLDNAALLARAGVRIAFSEGETHLAGRVRQLAGNAVAHGLPWDAALAALTANPAQMFQVADRGSIEVGRIADLVLWSGDPLEVTSVADRVWLGGGAVEMRSRQTELRDRYAGAVHQR